MPGKFISFEGPEGAGKTSVIKQILADLQAQRGVDAVMYSREPGGDPIAEQIRNVIVDEKNTALDARAEALLFAASRRQHLVTKILPALAKDKIILCDRYLDSSIAYQGAGRGLGTDAVWQINQFAIDGVMPELTIYLDLDPAIGLARIAKHRADETNRLDEEQLSFHQKVRRAYLDLATQDPERIKKVDANQPLANVVAEVKSIIHQHDESLF